MIKGLVHRRYDRPDTARNRRGSEDVGQITALAPISIMKWHVSLDPRGRDVKLVRAMKQYNEVIEIIPLAVQVPHVINQVQRVAPQESSVAIENSCLGNGEQSYPQVCQVF